MADLEPTNRKEASRRRNVSLSRGRAPKFEFEPFEHRWRSAPCVAFGRLCQLCSSIDPTADGWDCLALDVFKISTFGVEILQ